ncbi:MAG: penicillin-binding protein A, partial [Oscillospiraceae bacterium]|nr:penicillin-binding protein A [Oscillospiraceae bacterium]
MDDKKQFSRRLLAIGVLFSLVLAAYFVTLFDAQIVHGAEYRARSIRANTKSETVVTSRGILTDRNGKALVTNRSVYTLELDTSLAPSDDAALNKELLRLIELLENRGIVWEDTLPLTAGAPFAYDFSVSGSHTAFNSYIVSKKWADEDTLTTDTDPPLSPETLLSRLRAEFKADEDLTDTEARKLVGLRYCL